MSKVHMQLPTHLNVQPKSTYLENLWSLPLPHFSLILNLFFPLLIVHPSSSTRISLVDKRTGMIIYHAHTHTEKNKSYKTATVSIISSWPRRSPCAHMSHVKNYGRITMKNFQIVFPTIKTHYPEHHKSFFRSLSEKFSPSDLSMMDSLCPRESTLPQLREPSQPMSCPAPTAAWCGEQ